MNDKEVARMMPEDAWKRIAVGTGWKNVAELKQAVQVLLEAAEPDLNASRRMRAKENLQGLMTQVLIAPTGKGRWANGQIDEHTRTAVEQRKPEELVRAFATGLVGLVSTDEVKRELQNRVDAITTIVSGKR